MLNKQENYMSLTFPSRSTNEAFARAAIAAFVAQLDPTLDELGDIKTAVSEAVTNCIVHAYPDTVGEISLRAWVTDGSTLHISIRDHGVGIEDISRAREPMFTTGSEERSGMGFTIMQTFMNELKVSSHTGKGTTIHMKRIVGKRGGRA